VEEFSDWTMPVDRLLERAKVRSCIALLPDNYWQVLLLCDIEELSTGDVATVLSMTPTAVK
jgi:DNA-directed RNA polymerase specialized sigma24 family protein